MTKPTHTCWTIRERGEDQKEFWLPIGSCWTNKDGSFNIRLNALPIDGKITVRLRKDKDEQVEQPALIAANA